MNKKLPKARNSNIVVQNLDKEILIYDLNTNKACCLNETSAKVFNACDVQISLSDLKSKFQLTDDIIFLALDELKKHDLLVEDADYKSPLVGQNRRELIKKIGLATMIVLPLVAAIVAPGAAAAQSVCSYAIDPPPPTCTSSITVFNYGCASSVADCSAKVNAVKAQYCCLSGGHIFQAPNRCRLECVDF